MPANPAFKVFISYRRTDSPGHAGHLHEILRGRFGRDRVFFDVSAIEGGSDFAVAVRRAIDDSDVVIVVIGPEWSRRPLIDRLLSRPDWVRFEIEYARAAGKPLLPVLVDGAAMPRSLPASVGFLSTIHATALRNESWDPDVDRLLARLPALAASTPAVGGAVPREEGTRWRRVLVPVGAAALGATLLLWASGWLPGLSRGGDPGAGTAPPVQPAPAGPPAAQGGAGPVPAPPTGTKPAPAANNPPRGGSISVDQTNATGLMSATRFTLTAKGIVDPDGDALTYRWDFGDGSPSPPSSATVTKVYDRVNRFTVRLFVNDGKLAEDVLAAETPVTVRDVTGTWRLSVSRDPKAGYTIPTSYEVTLVQQGNQLSGRILPAGGPSTVLTGHVEHPNRVQFGSEHAWWNDDSDAYFNLYVSDGALFIQMMNATPGRCGPQIPCLGALMNKQ